MPGSGATCRFFKLSTPARAYKARGIVLRARNLGEADKIFTLFTDAFGKVEAVGKGVRRAKSHLAGRLQFASEVALVMHRGRTLDIITSAELLVPSWQSIVAPDAFGTAHLVAELIDAFCEPDLALPDVYALLHGVLRALKGAAEPAQLIPRFELRLLGALGFAPQSEACIGCGGTLDAVAGWADVAAGGLACERCRPQASEGSVLSAADVVNFRALAAGGGGVVAPALHATPAAARAVDAFLTWHLGRRPRASKPLADLATDSSAYGRR